MKRLQQSLVVHIVILLSCIRVHADEHQKYSLGGDTDPKIIQVGNPQRFTLEGDINHKIVEDSLLLSYDLFVRGWKPDTLRLETVLLGGNNRELLILNRDNGPGESGIPSFHLKSNNGVHRLRGEAKVWYSKTQKLRGCYVSVTGRTKTGRITRNKWVEFHRGGALTLTLLPPLGVAYYKTNAPPDSTRDGPAGGFEFNIQFDYRHARLTSGYRATVGKGFVVKEAVPLKCRYYLGTKSDFLPAFSAGIKYSVLDYEVGGTDRKTTDWGLEAGAALEGPFGRLSYDYCTGLDGYHKIGLFVVNKSQGLGKSGTLYEYYRFQTTDMFRMAIYYEGIGMGEGVGHGTASLPRRYNRPFVHKALACAGMLPALPVYYIIMFLSP